MNVYKLGICNLSHKLLLEIGSCFADKTVLGYLYVVITGSKYEDMFHAVLLLTLIISVDLL